MKFSSPDSAGGSPRHHAAFTLVEMMVATGIYMVIFVSALVALQVFALRVYTLGATKITATQSSRKALNQIRTDIQQGKGVQVGVTDNAGNFTAYAGTSLAVGNALQVFATTNFSGAPYSLYYLKTNTVQGVSSNNLIWISVTTNGTAAAALATYVTNLDVFAAVDCNAVILTNCIKNNQCFTVKLQFYQWEYPIAVLGTNGAANAYDYYQLRTKVCRRALD